MTDTTPVTVDENQLIAERRTKLQALRQRQAAGGAVAFPNDFKPAHHADALHTAHGAKTAEALAEEKHLVRIAGRMVLKRVMGKASFATLQDGTGRMQVDVKGEEIGTELYEEFKHWDLGDFVGAVGHVFKTKTGELSVHVTELRLLTKSLRPLPDKFHGVHDQEIKYRQRYVDLIVNEDTRATFLKRSKIIQAIRNVLVADNYLEVETPMMHQIPGGAAARPFVTHHNALDMQLFLRIAPELYLKRLVVGGFEKVFEINRNFRNEGMSTRHNPEFTMLEFYCAYMEVNGMMDFIERLIRETAAATGQTKVV